ncbi:MAG: VOC family protein [Bryobacteraceae bacterium]
MALRKRILSLLIVVSSVWSQARAQPVARGLYNWIHTTGDAERAFPFYRDVLGIQLDRSPFAGPPPANAPAPSIRPRSQASSDPLIWDLTDTHGSRSRTVFMHVPNTPFGLELSEFIDIPRTERISNPWDPGTSMLMFEVRDLDATVARLKAFGSPIVTLGGLPLPTTDGPSLLVRDPDGYLVKVTQASRQTIAAAEASGDVVRTSIGISVTDLPSALAFYQKLLGFNVSETGTASPAELLVHGLTKGELTQTSLSIPGSAVHVLLQQFRLPSDATSPPNPFLWKIQDVGAPQFQLEVSGTLDALIERTKAAGYRFLSRNAKPIQRPFGRFVFAIDPDGVLVEFVEPQAQQ